MQPIATQIAVVESIIFRLNTPVPPLIGQSGCFYKPGLDVTQKWCIQENIAEKITDFDIV
ncbi:hypothetical protein Oscil6304_1019 [Oscillatoria acuminata PCC 6304]|uniref:Uncharacterized protein n=1 Tax=Oscillatoria acuminata PCC 6304 TaxID=56110 RepID=K9TEA2_9CYAN|nr:hypothetical protein Oscil6304_1019 [Oscillatoria acuminata PCC 6304]